MLYSLYEAQHAALQPLRLAAELSRGWFGHPFSPLAYSYLSRGMAAGSDLFLRLTQRYEKPAWRIDYTTVGGERVAVTAEVALAKPFCNLIHFKRELAAPRNDPKVLLVAPLSGHHATLLRDTVRTMLPEHEV